MKRVIIASFLLIGYFSGNAQDAAVPTMNYSALEKKVQKSDEDIVDDKAKVKAYYLVYQGRSFFRMLMMLILNLSGWE